MNTLQQQATIITRYLTEMKLTQAVLITGEWGVGKTFFVREILQKQLEESGLTVIFSSLYGVNSLESVQEDLVYSVIQSKLKKKELKGKKIPAFLLEKFPSVVKIAARHLNVDKDDVLDINDLINFDFKDVVLVFDDLERAGIDINTILGFINNYVESTNAKVIVIANEDEIGSSKLSTDLPQKYLVSACPNIQISHNNDDNKNGEGEDNSITYEQLVERTQLLFSNDIHYAKIKEKLIGLTIAIDLNYSDIYDELIRTYANELAQKELYRMKSNIITLFEELECRNLRTIIFCIVVFDRIFNLISSLYKDEPEYDCFVENEITDIFKYIVYTSFNYKAGKENNHEKSNISKTIFCVKHNLTPYEFIDSFVYKHLLSDDIYNDVESRINEKYEKDKEKRERDELSIFKLMGFEWLYIDDQKVELYIQKMYTELKDEKYDERYFKDIIMIFCQLDHYDFNMSDDTPSVEDFVVLMQIYINNHDINDRFLDVMEMFAHSDLNEKYTSIVHMLKNTINEKKTKEFSTDFRSIFNEEAWDEQLYHYCISNRESFLLKKCFLAHDFTVILSERICSLSNRQIVRLCDSICSVYNFNNLNEFFKDDSDQLKQLIEMLCVLKESSQQQTQKIILSSSIERLESKLKLIEQ